MQARYYDPVIGRFYSNDPVGWTPINPIHSFGRYIYGNNNPYKYIDPDGKFAESPFDGFTKLFNGLSNEVKSAGNSIKQGGKILANVPKEILTSEPVKEVGDQMGYIPHPIPQGISTAINVANILSEPEGVAGDVAGNQAKAKAEKTHIGKGGSLKAKAYNYLVDKATAAVTQSGVEEVLREPEVKEENR